MCDPIVTPKRAILAEESLLNLTYRAHPDQVDDIKRRISILQPLAAENKPMKLSEMMKLFE
jgi:hypothetical protein